MQIDEFSFLLRTIVPALCVILPAFAILTPINGMQVVSLLFVGLVAGVGLTFVLGKEIVIAEDGKAISIKYRFFNRCVWQRTMNATEFQHILIQREFVYTRDVPIPAYKGAFQCNLVGPKKVILKTGRSEKPVREAAV